MKQMQGTWELYYDPDLMNGIIELNRLEIDRNGECFPICRDYLGCPNTTFNIKRKDSKLVLAVHGTCEFCGNFILEPSEFIIEKGMPDTIYLVKDTLSLKLVKVLPFH